MGRPGQYMYRIYQERRAGECKIANKMIREENAGSIISFTGTGET